MKMMLRITGLLWISVLVLGSSLLFVNRAYADSPLPGINSEDKHPKGCVDCHVDAGGGKANRLNVELKKVKDHPDVGAMMNTLPQDCFMCHKEGGAASAINMITHKQHYANPTKNSFVSEYGGSCLTCHKVDLDTGEVTIKNGPKNW
jgi:hypothetical protein